MPVQFWLSDDNRPCVFCGHVSPKGVVTQVGEHRFFTCAECLEVVILGFLGEGIQKLTPSKDEPLHCVCCWRRSKVGFNVERNGNWSFTCENCATDVLPPLLAGWRDLSSSTWVMHPQRPNAQLELAIVPPSDIKPKELLSIIAFLKVLKKRISVQARLLSQKSQLGRRKAIELLNEGDYNNSRLQMKNCLQKQAWRRNIEDSQLELEGMQSELEQTKDMKDVASILANIARTIQSLSQTVSAPEITKIIDVFRRRFSDWGLFP